MLSVTGELNVAVTEAETRTYPGEQMDALAVLRLAEAYRDDAMHLLERRGCKSRSPFRLVAIHAIELYLNAYLLALGHPHTAIRGLQHDLGRRLTLLQEAGVVLRLRTAEHLKVLSSNREYLVSRYDSCETSSLSQLNRLQATMNEVRSRVTRKLAAS